MIRTRFLKAGKPNYGKTLENSGFLYQLVETMQGVMDSGTGAITRKMGFTLPAAGKTGITNSYQDAWFTGFTPTLSASVWAAAPVNAAPERKIRWF